MAEADLPSRAPPPSSPPIVEKRYRIVFWLVGSLFFSWAIASSLNDVLIRHFQIALSITKLQASLVQFAFYIGYFCAAIPASLLNRRYGYKTGILIGLYLYAAGAFLFYPASITRDYMVFLFALYTIAFGLAFLETSANPYIVLLGDPETSAARLTLAQSLYGLGAVTGPIIGGIFIFSGGEASPEAIRAMPAQALDAFQAAQAAAVQGPYLVIGLVICVLAFAIARIHFPDVASAGSAVKRRSPILRVLRHNSLRWAIATQFAYVGAQVGIWSFFIDFCREQLPQLPDRTAAFALSTSLALLMIGRFSGAFLQKKIGSGRLLAIYAAINILLCVIAALASGWAAIAALWATSFFMSIMFPSIFAFGIRGLSDETELAVPLLVMAIIGGAVVPPAMGLMSDHFGHLQYAMALPALCFAVCLAFAWRAPRFARGQG